MRRTYSLSTLCFNNDVDENRDSDGDDDEEQEVALEIGDTTLGPRRGTAGAAGSRVGSGTLGSASTLHAQYAMDQHQRYLEAVIGEHKVKDENRREALVVDVDSDDDDENDGNNYTTKESALDDDDTHNYYKEDDVDEDEDDREVTKYNDKDIGGDDDDDIKLYGTGRRDSGLEEKPQHSVILEKNRNSSLFEPLTYSCGSGSFKHGVVGNNTSASNGGLNGLHPRLSYSSSSDTGEAPGKEGKINLAHNTLSNSTANGHTSGSWLSRPTDPSVEKDAIKSFIENSGGVRVFPLGTGSAVGNTSLRHGNFRERNASDMVNHRGGTQETDSGGVGGVSGRSPPDPLPRGSPPVRYVRSMKAPPSAYSDFKIGTSTGETDLESFVELTDL
ncbi:hypothetical protein ElyMa_004014300 [Elysia marginata]|uniref:Uncharacterized protein n=1 Tax=Elysia marginata TaxID=1093978 RepID=A0AAV4G147_9GAST|nr:hypothetical protein ElyMa_004014300 [Elysia marginata]